MSNTKIKEKAPSKKEIKAETKRLRDFVSGRLYPLLIENSVSIMQAQTLCKTVITGMEAKFAQKMQEYQKYVQEDKLSMLELDKEIIKPKDSLAELAIIDLLKDEKIVNAKGLLEGMVREIDRLVKKETVSRKLDTLQTEWL